jgi:hypothetical protein
MARRLVPVNIAVLRMYLHIGRTTHCAAICDTCGLEPFEDGLELLFTHTETEVLYRVLLFGFNEVQG